MYFSRLLLFFVNYLTTAYNVGLPQEEQHWKLEEFVKKNELEFSTCLCFNDASQR